MSARLKGRRRQVATLLGAITAWAADGHPDIVGVLLVGSYARARPRMASDVDLILLTARPDRYLDGNDPWYTDFAPGGRPIRTQRWGAVTERRLRLPTGLHLELNIADPAWAVVPLDPGTRKVLGDGAQPLHDPDNILHHALTALATVGDRG